MTNSAEITDLLLPAWKDYEQKMEPIRKRQEEICKSWAELAQSNRRNQQVSDPSSVASEVFDEKSEQKLEPVDISLQSSDEVSSVASIMYGEKPKHKPELKAAAIQMGRIRTQMEMQKNTENVLEQPTLSKQTTEEPLQVASQVFEEMPKRNVGRPEQKVAPSDFSLQSSEASSTIARQVFDEKSEQKYILQYKAKTGVGDKDNTHVLEELRIDPAADNPMELEPWNASQDFVPLLLLTADRPPELEGAGANQSINQVNHFGFFVRFFFSLPTPTDDIPARMVLTTLDSAVHLATSLPCGPVHINCPFREPLDDSPSKWRLDSLAGLDTWNSSAEPFTKYITLQNSIARDDDNLFPMSQVLEKNQSS